jgi:hypothetical protein
MVYDNACKIEPSLLMDGVSYGGDPSPCSTNGFPYITSLDTASEYSLRQ